MLTQIRVAVLLFWKLLILYVYSYVDTTTYSQDIVLAHYCIMFGSLLGLPNTFLLLIFDKPLSKTNPHYWDILTAASVGVLFAFIGAFTIWYEVGSGLFNITELNFNNTLNLYVWLLRYILLKLLWDYMKKELIKLDEKEVLETKKKQEEQKNEVLKDTIFDQNRK